MRARYEHAELSQLSGHGAAQRDRQREVDVQRPGLRGMRRASTLAEYSPAALSAIRAFFARLASPRRTSLRDGEASAACRRASFVRGSAGPLCSLGGEAI